MDRMTKAKLNSALLTLNTYQLGKFSIEYLYGKCRLLRRNISGYDDKITNLGTMRETYIAIDAICTVQLTRLLDNA